MVERRQLDEELLEEELLLQLDPAVLHAMRERRRSFADPAKGLLRTHAFVQAASPFNDGAAFPAKDRQVTFAVDVRRDDTGARGVVAELGDSTTGLAIWVPNGGTDISACAGDVGADGVTVTAEDVLAANGQLASVVVSVIPGNGKMRIWVNGALMAAGEASGGSLPNGWAADENGGIGEVATTCTDRVPAGDKISLVNASIVSLLSAFVGQRPRQFNASPRS